MAELGSNAQHTVRDIDWQIPFKLPIFFETTFNPVPRSFHPTSFSDTFQSFPPLHQDCFSDLPDTPPTTPLDNVFDNLSANARMADLGSKAQRSVRDIK
mmetsp:Transcript_37907/g.64569  ORF Transcript_37907/g.64569 Transcript_37907/m.64569 type:complete len:99 (-) Transcript_37907:101-397(-)